MKPTDSAFPQLDEDDKFRVIDVRTYIATKVFAALYSSGKDIIDNFGANEVAHIAVSSADALIEELNRRDK